MKKHGRNSADDRNGLSARDAKRTRPGTGQIDGPYWIWGRHAVEAALANPERRSIRLLATGNGLDRLVMELPRDLDIEDVPPRQIDYSLPPGAVHQGLGLYVHPLEPRELADVIEQGADRIVVIDQMSDPQNIGAIFRSAAAFGFNAVVMQTRHTPPLTGVVAKAGVGALEKVTEVRVVNVARALDTLGDAGFLTVGLMGDAAASVADVFTGHQKIAVVIGAEGAGLRPAVAKACTTCASIPIAATMESLNASNAAAIAFYEVARAINAA